MSVFDYNAEMCFEEIERLGDIAAQKMVMIVIRNTEDARQIVIRPFNGREDDES